VSEHSVAVPRQIGVYPMVRLGTVAKVQSGLTLDAGKAVMNPTVTRPYLRVANVQDGWVDLTELKEVEVAQALAYRWELRPGDVLMTEGGDADKLGRGTVWRGEIPDCLHQNHIFAVRPGEKIHSDYLGFVTQTSYARAYFEATSSKTTGIASTSTSKIVSFRIPLPSIRDQLSIISFLKAEVARIDTLITKKRHMVELTREHFVTLLDQTVWAYRCPAVHLMYRTAQARPIMYGIVLPGPDVAGDGVPIVKGGDAAAEFGRPLSQTTAEIESHYVRSRLRAGDLVFAIRGGIGDVAQVPASAHGANITQDVARVSAGSSVNPRWLFHVLRSSRVQQQALERATGATIRGLNIWELKRLAIPDASPAIQDEVVASLDDAEARAISLEGKLRAQIDLLRERRQALITAAVTGEIELPARRAG
jgi:type I restriction enzyme, S subunit